MKKINKIILFTKGNSDNASTWSNVPFLMKRSLEEKGVSVIPINYEINPLLIRFINRLIKADRFFDYSRTNIFNLLVNHKIKKTVKIHKDADFCVFLTFDFINKYNHIPTLLFSDWTYRIWLERYNHIPNKRENGYIYFEDKKINQASLIIPLFEESYFKMQKQYPNANIKLIKRNVVNILDNEELNEKSIIETKNSSNQIIFIGRPAYKEGLEVLKQAISKVDFDIILNVVGIEGENTEKVKYYGYLRKDNKEENHLYYKLLREARVIVNPTKNWSGYSSLIEAMFYYTPVIVFPFKQFQLEFGEKLSFGYYCKDNPENVKAIIIQIFNLPEKEYHDLCINAHNSVKDYTWSNYVEEMLDIMTNYLTSKNNV